MILSGVKVDLTLQSEHLVCHLDGMTLMQK
jgi:hypothetical protein